MDDPVLSFACGDVVRWANKKKPQTDLIISDIEYYQGSFSYGVDGNAWFDSSELVFVRRADKASLELLSTLMEEEEDEDYDE